ncbi:MAG TPA: hypothetical protein VKT25_05375 [Ktedonobacteraceae bacterium]|nr:hypothetical protein [Ktedonobacteraceae bacterium]
MTPFDGTHQDIHDDLLPEEHDAQHQSIVRALSHSYVPSSPLSADEQADSVARVRERLLANQPAQSQSNEQDEQQAGIADSTPLHPIALAGIKRRRRFVNFINGLAAVLVIGAILGASVLLFTRHSSPGVATPALPTGNNQGLSIIASSTVDGLTMTLAITPGPYFLSEMLEVKVTLVNNSTKNVYPGLPFEGGSCGYYPGVEINYTGNPEFNIPIPFDHSCPAFGARPLTLKPGKTASITRYTPLQKSGELTITVPANFYTGPGSQQLFPGPTSVPNPFGSQGLVARIQVSKTIPANLKIPFTVKGYYATVEVPKSAKGPLLYAYSIGCQDYNNDGGSTWSGNFGWDTLANPTIRRPGCPGKNLQWSFAFAIPGYAVAVGSDNDPIK